MKPYCEYLKDYAYDNNSKLLTREQIIERIQNCDLGDEQVGQDILNGIVTWKTNRRIYVDPSIIKNIKELSSKLKNVIDIDSSYEDIGIIWESLIKSPGVRAAMASTILHMFMPNVFLIIDQRAYREIYEGKKMPSKISFDDYVKYLKDVEKYRLNNCPQIEFKEMDKVLFQIDKEKGNSVNH